MHTYVHKYVWSMCASICSCVCICGDQRCMSYVIYHFPPYFFEMGVSDWTWHSAIDWLKSKSSKSFCLHLSSTKITGACWMPSFLHEYWDLKSGPHDCTVNTLSTESSPQPMSVYFLKCCKTSSDSFVSSTRFLVCWGFSGFSMYMLVMWSVKGGRFSSSFPFRMPFTSSAWLQ